MYSFSARQFENFYLDGICRKQWHIGSTNIQGK